MLQELDSLTARVRQLVLATRDFQSQRDQLQSQIVRLEQERNALREALDQRESAYADAVNRLAQQETALQTVTRDCDAKLDAIQAQAQTTIESLRRELLSCQSERDAALRQAQSALERAEHMRQAVGQAQALVDNVLMRLPGAPQE